MMDVRKIDPRDQLITVTEDGPYMVEGRVEITNAEGEVVSTEGKVFLCRCGGSQSKPFCDGTHNKNDFSGAEVADRGPIAKRRQAYEGDGITLYDDRSVCSHAGECTDSLPSVWKLKEEPWIDAKAASAEQIAEVVSKCPSGALSYARGDNAQPVEEPMQPAIRASTNGPYHVRGGIQVASPDGAGYEPRNRQTLCRCGGSKNKPFCDGTHWYERFKDPA
jgi:CDGSH-type Zn-finger protein